MSITCFPGYFCSVAPGMVPWMRQCLQWTYHKRDCRRFRYSESCPPFILLPGPEPDNGWYRQFQCLECVGLDNNYYAL